ncbi:MAG: hypothetical protein CENE_01823 [Candidatus Celerinatantimonas neptuna]|nr:MAG: hypothetical protein CENE_01823 [Candidatus Celerinatantimonas neptuna]
MITLDKVKDLVREYQTKYRNPALKPFDYIERFNLVTKTPVCPELAAKKGVYVILQNDTVLYIGKSSAQKKAIWHRIVDHMYSSKPSSWAKDATHFIGWAVADDLFFEASALEEFLIFKLRDSLPNNCVGK